MRNYQLHKINRDIQQTIRVGQLPMQGGMLAVISAVLLAHGQVHGQAVLDLDSDGVADIIDIDQDNDGIINTLEGVARLADLSESSAYFYAAQPVDATSRASSHRYGLLRLDNGQTATLVGTVLSSDTEVEWSMFNTLPRLRNLTFGNTVVQWTLEGEGAVDNIDFTISDLDGLRSETVSVAEPSVVGYSLALNSNVAVSSDNGQLIFTGTGGGDSIDDLVTLHFRDTAVIEITYSNGLSDNGRLIGELGIAGYRHSLESHLSTFFTPVTQYRDSDADGVADHRDLDSDNDGLGDVIESGGADVDHDNLSDGAVDQRGLSVNADPGLSIESLSLVYIGDNTVSGEDADGDGLLSSVDGNLQGFGGALSNADRDGDDLNDLDEVRIHLTSPDEADSDNDGLTDGAEISLYKTNPLESDSDQDGLTDGDEINQYGTNPVDDDSDADGISDLVEIQNGTDPLESDRIIVVLQDPVLPVPAPLVPTPEVVTPEEIIPAESIAIESPVQELVPVDASVADLIDESVVEPDLLLADDSSQSNGVSLRTGLKGAAGCSIVSSSGSAASLLLILSVAIGGLANSTRRRKYRG